MPNLCVRGHRPGEAAGRDHPAGLTAGWVDVLIIVPYPANWLTAIAHSSAIRSLPPGLVRVHRDGGIDAVALLGFAEL